MQWKKNKSIIQKDQTVPRLFVGLCPKRLWDSDSVSSPTSPLDAKVVLPNAAGGGRRNSNNNQSQKRSWDCSKIGLSCIVQSREDRNCERKKIISLSPQMMVKKICVNSAAEVEEPNTDSSCKVPDSKSEPVIHNKGECESNVVFEIGDTAQELGIFVRSRSCPLNYNSYKNFSGLSLTASKTFSDNIDGGGAFALKDLSIIGGSSSNSFPLELKKSNTVSSEYLMSLSPSEIELSEDYTCVITHGPNPKTTHIFGDCILETNARVIKNCFKIDGMMDKGMSTMMMMPPPQAPNYQFPSSDEYFLSFCHHCNKKLEEKKDIYIYGGDKAFCSFECREIEIMVDENLEKSNNNQSENSPKPKTGEKLFEQAI